MALSTSYGRFADGVEAIQPNEDQLGDLTVASMARLAHLLFEKNRHALRDAHAKSHGMLRGELHVAPTCPRMCRWAASTGSASRFTPPPRHQRGDQGRAD